MQIIFTISPVRHLREGVIDNNRSKAVLIQAVHDVANNNDAVYYFPAYELVIDDLRDYRFYESDGAHPNHLAIEYIFSKFKKVFFDDITVQYFEEAIKLSKLKSHIPIHQQGEEYQKWIIKIEEMESVFKAKYQL